MIFLSHWLAAIMNYLVGALFFVGIYANMQNTKLQLKTEGAA
jgi:hypothetical protein